MSDASVVDPHAPSSEDTLSRTSSANTAPPTPDDISRWQHHIGFEKFAESLQAAAKAAFPNQNKSRYSKVSVLLLSWEDEDPKLPVSMEVDKLEHIFRDLYGFQTELWRIPDQNSHLKVNQKIIDLISSEDDPKQHLFIVYYAGHAILTRDRLLAWTGWRRNQSPKYPTVQWSGIQNVLEQAESDVLILLDCCHAGTATASEGNGATELISACAYNSQANGVGYYSFTKELIIELRELRRQRSFTVAELYRNIFCRIQSRRPEEEDRRERHPAPVHLSLTQDHPRFPRSIQICPLPSKADLATSMAMLQASSTSQYRGNVQSCQSGSGTGTKAGKDPSYETEGLDPMDGITHEISEDAQESNAAFAIHPEGMGKQSTQYVLPEDARIKSQRVPSLSPLTNPNDVPRILFAIRLKDSVLPQELSVDLFRDWLQNIPIAAEEVRVEAGFGSFSSIVIISLPVMLSIYLPRDPSIINIGPITTKNLLESKPKDSPKNLESTADLFNQGPQSTTIQSWLSSRGVESDEETPYYSDTSEDSLEVASSTAGIVGLVFKFATAVKSCKAMQGQHVHDPQIIDRVRHELEVLQASLQQLANLLMRDASGITTQWYTSRSLARDSRTFARSVHGFELIITALQAELNRNESSDDRFHEYLVPLKSQTAALQLLLQALQAGSVSEVKSHVKQLETALDQDGPYLKLGLKQVPSLFYDEGSISVDPDRSPNADGVSHFPWNATAEEHDPSRQQTYRHSVSENDQTTSVNASASPQLQHPSSGLNSNPSPPFSPTEILRALRISQGRAIQPEIHVKFDKGFFIADGNWTCYRRNYFSLVCSYSLWPNTPDGSTYVDVAGQLLEVHGFAMSISAIVDGRDGKSVELIQHTPKNDKGSQQRPGRVSLAPMPDTASDMRSLTPPLSNEEAIEATFERIQFKNATANNGKRRAAQQYYHLLVELFADLGPGAEQGASERWVKVAIRMSAPLVVRGRSPAHYQSERRASDISTGPGGAGGSAAGGAAGHYFSLLGGGSSLLGSNHFDNYGRSYSTGPR